MPEAAVVPTTPQPSTTAPAEGVKPEGAAPKKSKMFLNDPSEEQISQFEAEVGEKAERRFLDDEIDKAQKANPTSPKKAVPPVKKAKEGEPAPTGEKLAGAEEEADPEKLKVEGKKKFKVDGKEYELTSEQQERFTQKGIFYEKQAIEMKKEQQAIGQRLEQLEAREAKLDRVWDALEKDPRGLMLQLHGPQKTREIFEPVLAEQIKEELLPEHEKAQLAMQRRAEAAESRLTEIQQENEQRAMQAQETEAATHFETVITQALQAEGIPKNDQTVAEMARWLKRVEARNEKLPEGQQIKVTPERLAKVVREDNIEKSRALVDRFVNKITEAKKTGNADEIVSVGEQLVEMFGEPVVHAIAQFHLARLRKTQPTVPKKVLETKRVEKPEQKRGGYMDPDAYAAERRKRVAALDRGEEVADWS